MKSTENKLAPHILAGAALCAALAVASMEYYGYHSQETRVEDAIVRQYGGIDPTADLGNMAVSADMSAQPFFGKRQLEGITISGIGKCSLLIDTSTEGRFSATNDDSGAEILYNRQVSYSGPDKNAPDILAIDPGQPIPDHYYVGQVNPKDLVEAANNCEIPGETISP